MTVKHSPGVHHEVVTINGAQVHYSVAGDGGTPVVLVHGGASTRRDWEKNIPALAAHHSVYAPDLIGFGQSTRLDMRYTAQHFSEFLCDFMDAMGIARAAFVGHSLGGRACLEIACQAPDRVERMVLVAPIGFGSLSPAGWLLGTAFWALFNLLRKPLPYPALDVQLQEPDIDGFGVIEAPTLILWGRWDPYFPSKYGGRALRAIPNSKLKLFGQSGHSPHQREPAEFNRVVADFLSQ